MLELGGAEMIQGHTAEAEEDLREACEACRKAFGPVDPRTLQALRVRTTNLITLPQRREEALRMVDEVIDLISRRLGPEESLVFIMMNHKAGLLDQAGQLDEAETLSRRAVEGFRAGGMDRRPSMDAVATLAHILRTRGGPGMLTEAERLQRSVIAFYDARIGPDYGSTVELRKVEIELLLLLDRPAEAEGQARIILDGHQRLYGPDSINTLKSQARLARVLLAEGVKLEEAENLARHSAELTPRLTAPAEDYAVYHAATLADARRARGSPAEGLSQCERLVAITGGPETANAGWAAGYLRGVQGRCLTDLGRFDDAAAAFDLALKNADRWGDPASAIRVTVIRSAVAMCDKAGRAEAAAKWRAMLPAP
jgi:tetratricopeptide (TPR) repeat protein